MSQSDKPGDQGRRAISRNASCPCGSGKKYKACCGRIEISAPASGQKVSRRQLLELAQLLNEGHPDAVESRLRALLADHSNQGELWHLLGLAQRRQGKSGLEALGRAVALLPGAAEAHVNLGNEFARIGRHVDAIDSYERALRLSPGTDQALQNLGEALLATGAAEQAHIRFCRIVERHPENARAHYGMARALADLGRLTESEAAFRRAIALDGSLVEAYNSLGNLLRSQSRLDDALDAYQHALALDPQLAELHSNIAVVWRLQGHGVRSQESCRRALELNPGLEAALITWAESEADAGHFAAAEALYRRALAVAPESVDAWAGLGRLRRLTPADNDWLESVQLILKKPLLPRQESVLRYIIGKYFDEVGDYAAAFEAYRRANELDSKLHPSYNRGAMSAMVDKIVECQDRAWLDAHRQRREISECPVLVVGMPRSGTSLVEQILAAHRSVVGAGELMYWAQVAARVQRDTLGELAGAYLKQLTLHSAGALRVVDKMPSNFLHLGLVHAALPAARVIHVQRDPVDTCLSIYFQHFEGFHSYANDLDDLVHIYREYQRVMAHWRAALPAGVMLEVPYAALIEDPERWTRRMIEFIGLPWDSRCLEFHRRERSVLTASQWQVRQPISRLGLDRWRHYQQFIGPLRSLWPEGRPPR
jgi:tetratricopeptide (TPR) repeat protein